MTIVELNKIKFTETSKLSKYRDAELRGIGPNLPNSKNNSNKSELC